MFALPPPAAFEKQSKLFGPIALGGWHALRYSQGVPECRRDRRDRLLALGVPA
jgi:hypothetical protein